MSELLILRFYYSIARPLVATFCCKEVCIPVRLPVAPSQAAAAPWPPASAGFAAPVAPLIAAARGAPTTRFQQAEATSCRRFRCRRTPGRRCAAMRTFQRTPVKKKTITGG